MNLNRRIGGLKAKRNGQLFENVVKSQCERLGWAVVRIPDGSRTLGLNKIIRVKSPFDFCIAKRGNVIFFDAKSWEGATWAKSKVNDKQVEHLLKLEAAWQVSGYMVFFKKIDRVIFFTATQLDSLNARESLLPGQGIDLGSIKDFDPELAL